MDKFAPFKTFTVRKPGGTPWITDEIKGKMDERDKAKDTFNFTGDQNFFDMYRILKNGVNYMMRREQFNLFNAEINSKVKSSKDFYRAAKKLNLMSDKKAYKSGTFNITPKE